MKVEGNVYYPDFQNTISEEEEREIYSRLADLLSTVTRTCAMPIFNSFPDELSRMRFVKNGYVTGQYHFRYDPSNERPYGIIQWIHV